MGALAVGQEKHRGIDPQDLTAPRADIGPGSPAMTPIPLGRNARPCHGRGEGRVMVPEMLPKAVSVEPGPVRAFGSNGTIGTTGKHSIPDLYVESEGMCLSRERANSAFSAKSPLATLSAAAGATVSTPTTKATSAVWKRRSG